VGDGDSRRGQQSCPYVETGRHDDHLPMKIGWTTFAALAMTAGSAMQLLATSTLDVRT
jgi:hypothetical protein